MVCPKASEVLPCGEGEMRSKAPASTLVIKRSDLAELIVERPAKEQAGASAA